MRRPYFLRRGTSILRPNEYRPADDVPYEPPRGVPPRARRRRHLGDDRAPLHRAVWAHARHEHRILAGASGHGVSGALGARVPSRAVPSGRAGLALGGPRRRHPRGPVRARLPIRHRGCWRGGSRGPVVHRAGDRCRPRPRDPEGSAHHGATAARCGGDGGRRPHRDRRQQRRGGGGLARDRGRHCRRPAVGAVRVLFFEALGGVAILGVVLTLVHHAPAPPPTAAAWRGLVALTAGSVLAANLFFFAAVRRIEAAPAAVAATIEPVVGTLLALLLFSQRLTAPGWLGLAMVVGGEQR